ncbi:MarR family winged helix-turn-helix transcriptional regulator [Paenibacillus sinopodophylli]|uniref:MarR family winged helix-turn-helix transcriptional regulator n=1 Tax=Paenibacillus sinopodophylli TaxID=1837342 RepID=UPI00110CE463|nr:MarR family transcriptional regulator [Paenibacillus sinopodophylli]
MNNNNDALNIWFSLSNSFHLIHDKLEKMLEEQYDLSLKEFYVLYFISNTDDKELRLQQIQEMVGLSQSATSRLIVRMEEKDCGALERHVCEDDKRGIYTRITELGENKFQRALKAFNELLQKEFEQGEMTKLQTIFNKM